MRIMRALFFAFALMGCALSHEPSTDAEGPRVDGGPLDGAMDDADAAPLAPPCAAPPRCRAVVRVSARAERPPGTGPVSALAVPSATLGPDGLHVLLQVEDPDRPGVTLVDHTVSPVSLMIQRRGDVDRMERPVSSGADALGTPLRTTFVWQAIVGLRDDQRVETRWRVADDNGSLSAALVASSLPVLADAEPVWPALVSLVDRTLSVGGRGHEVGFVDLERGERRAFRLDAPLWDSIESHPLDGGERFTILWHELDEEGFAHARVAVATYDGFVTEPVTALAALSQRATHLVLGESVWVAGFERTGLLGESRLRVTRLGVSSLQRTEADWSFSGWGGLLPASIKLVTWSGQPWLLWITDDTRFGSFAVVYAEPLSTESCAATITTPALVSSAPFDWSRRGVRGHLAAVGQDELFIAHTIGDAGAFDVHALEQVCAP